MAGSDVYRLIFKDFCHARERKDDIYYSLTEDCDTA